MEYVSVLDVLALLGEMVARNGVASQSRQIIGQEAVDAEASKRVRAWVLANRNVVPSVDLAQVLGIN